MNSQQFRTGEINDSQEAWCKPEPQVLLTNSYERSCRNT